MSAEDDFVLLYSYNGYEFPAPPSSRSYEYIILSSGVYYFYASSAEASVSLKTDGSVSLSASGSSGTYYCYKYDDVSSWTYVTSDQFKYSSWSRSGTLIWSLTDVYLSDGTLFMSGTTAYPSNGRITSVVIAPVSLSLSVAQSYQFQKYVYGEGVFGTAVTWEVSGNTSSSTSINGVGLLTVGADETSSSLTVTATSVEDTSVSGSAVVSVSLPTDDVSYISVSPSSSSVRPGSVVDFSESVYGVGDFDSSVVWSISGNDSSNTCIDTNGTLTVSEDETSSLITVTATSVHNSSMYSSVAVTVSHSYVTEVVVSPDRVVVSYDGMSQQVQLSASVLGVGDFDSSVIWECQGQGGCASIDQNGLLTITLSDDQLLSGLTSFTAFVNCYSVEDSSIHDGCAIFINLTSSSECACSSILDYLMTAFEFYPFDPNTGTLSTTPEEINGLVPAFYRFMQSMEEKLGALSMNVTPSKQEQALREETAEIADTAIEEFYGEDSEIKVTGKDVSLLSKLLKRLTKILDTGVGVDSLFDLFDDESNLSWFSQEVANDLNTVGSVASVHSNDNYDASPDEHEQYNMHYYDEKMAELEKYINGES